MCWKGSTASVAQTLLEQEKWGKKGGGERRVRRKIQ